jgi:predicted nucleotidyltransferase
VDGLIFDVKGLIHPSDRVIAFVRYIPNRNGNRIRDGVRYQRMYRLEQRFAFLRQHYPHYLRHDPVFGVELIEVPVNRIVRHYHPISKLNSLCANSSRTRLQQKAVDFATFIVNSANIPRKKIGVSGSLLVELASSSSDIDLIVYGVENAYRVNDTLKEHLKIGTVLRPYDLKTLKMLHHDRCQANGVSFSDYVFHEQRKFFQGVIDGTDFFVRYIRDWGECDQAYGENTYASLGRVTMSGLVTKSYTALFTPCFYEVNDVEVNDSAPSVPIGDIVSFRGRYCQQAQMGEQVRARGKLERVTGKSTVSYQLVVGNRPEDFLVVVR